jgi:hypothetical protein
LIWEITKENIELDYTIGDKIKEFQVQNKEEYESIKEENELLILQKTGSIYSTVS